MAIHCSVCSYLFSARLVVGSTDMHNLSMSDGTPQRYTIPAMLLHT